MSYNDFSEMPVWQLALGVVTEVYNLTDTLPKREDYALCSQLRRAVTSITGNIAEAFGRGHPKDKINFYYFSRGSAYEVKGHLLAGIAVGYFSPEQTSALLQHLDQIIAALNSIIKSLRITSQT